MKSDSIHGCVRSCLCECECCEKLSNNFVDAMEALTLERARGDKWFSAWLRERQARNFRSDRPLDARGDITEEGNSRTAERLARLQTLRYGAPVKRGRAVRLR